MSQTEPDKTTPTIRCTVTARVGTNRAALVVRLPDGAGPAWAPGTQVLLTLLPVAADADQSGCVQRKPPTWCSYCDYPCRACLSAPRVDPSGLAGGGDPSGAVVELPGDAVEALCGAVGHALATHPRITGSALAALANADGRSAVELRERVLTVIAEAAFPLIAARVRAEAVADERRRLAAVLFELMTGIVPQPAPEWDEAVGMLRGALRAAGSVPVATPQPVGMNAPNGEPLMAVKACAHGFIGPHHGCPGPVATPTEPDQDMLDDVDRLRSMWRESPGTRAYVEDRYPGLAHAIERAVMHEAASPVPAEQPPSAPAESWGDLAADVMGLVDRTLDGEVRAAAVAALRAGREGDCLAGSHTFTTAADDPESCVRCGVTLDQLDRAAAVQPEER